MKLKAIIHENDYHLATESGEIIENVESCKVDSTGCGVEGDLLTITFKVTAVYGTPATIVDADETAVRALPAAEVAYDYDPDDYAPIFHDEDCDCEEDIDFMEGLCPDCAQEICLDCLKCCTPACEAEECNCIPF